MDDAQLSAKFWCKCYCKPVTQTVYHEHSFDGLVKCITDDKAMLAQVTA